LEDLNGAKGIRETTPISRAFVFLTLSASSLWSDFRRNEVGFAEVVLAEVLFFARFHLCSAFQGRDETLACKLAPFMNRPEGGRTIRACEAHLTIWEIAQLFGEHRGFSSCCSPRMAVEQWPLVLQTLCLVAALAFC
jgi:hypothetical protein